MIRQIVIGLPFFKKKAMNDLIVRDAILCDAEDILGIYSYYVENTAISFEHKTPCICEFKERMEGIMKRYPYIVIEGEGKILGYAYANTFKDRKAYDWSVELSIYIKRDSRGNGLGRRLYEALEERLESMGIKNLYACIAYPDVCDDEYLDRSSVLFHQHMGFKTVGLFKDCGRKFDRWYSMIWMEKIIGTHDAETPAVRPYRYK